MKISIGAICPNCSYYITPYIVFNNNELLQVKCKICGYNMTEEFIKSLN